MQINKSISLVEGSVSFSIQIDNIISKSKVNLQFGKWDKLQMQKECKKIQRWNVNQLFINGNNKANILKDITHIAFPFLIKLQLSSNQIQTIQPLSFLNNSCLQVLLIDQNNLRQIKPLRKLKWLDLQVLSLYNNPFIDFQHFCSITTSEIIKYIHLQAYGSQQLISDARWLFKLQAKNLFYLQIQGDQRISQQNVMQKLQKKYIDIGISRKRHIYM